MIQSIILFLLFWQASKACGYSSVIFQLSLYLCCSPALCLWHSPWLHFDFLYKSYSYEYLLTSLPEEVLEESPLFPEVFPFHVNSCFCSFRTLLYGYPFCCVCLIWKLPVCYQRWNAERRGEIYYIPHICSISSQMKWSHQAPLVRPGMNQTPLCCVHAIPGARFCPQQLSI